LGLDYVDILHVHDVEHGDLDQIINETIPAIRRLKQQGKVRYIGISGYPLKALKYILERTELDVILTYAHYTLHDNTLLDAIPFLKSRGVGIINAAPLALGLLTQKGPPDWHLATDKIKKVCREAAEYCKEQGVDIAKLAIQYAIDQEDVSTLLVGISNVRDLEKNIAWIEEPINNPELLKKVETVLEPIHNNVWVAGRLVNN